MKLVKEIFKILGILILTIIIVFLTYQNRWRFMSSVSDTEYNEFIVGEWDYINIFDRNVSTFLVNKDNSLEEISKNIILYEDGSHRYVNKKDLAIDSNLKWEIKNGNLSIIPGTINDGLKPLLYNPDTILVLNNNNLVLSKFDPTKSYREISYYKRKK